MPARAHRRYVNAVDSSGGDSASLVSDEWVHQDLLALGAGFQGDAEREARAHADEHDARATSLLDQLAPEQATAEDARWMGATGASTGVEGKRIWHEEGARDESYRWQERLDRLRDDYYASVDLNAMEDDSLERALGEAMDASGGWDLRTGAAYEHESQAREQRDATNVWASAGDQDEEQAASDVYYRSLLADLDHDKAMRDTSRVDADASANQFVDLETEAQARWDALVAQVNLAKVQNPRPGGWDAEQAELEREIDDEIHFGSGVLDRASAYEEGLHQEPVTSGPVQDPALATGGSSKVERLRRLFGG